MPKIPRRPLIAARKLRRFFAGNGVFRLFLNRSAALAAALLLLAACSGKSGFPSAFTRGTAGKISFVGGASPGEVLLLVVQSRKTFIRTPSGYLDHAVVFVRRQRDRMEYEVEMGGDIHRQKIYFLGEGYSLGLAETERTLGSGADRINVALQKSKDWDGNFTFRIKPFLVNFIELYRNEMNPRDLSLLYRWLDENEKAVNLRRAQSEPHPEPAKSEKPTKPE